MAIIRKTKAVKTLLEVFEKEVDAQSGVDLVERFESQMNKTTVYRILERLEKEGILHSFQDYKGLTWYAKCEDCSSGHHKDFHPHFQCKNCGKIECLSQDLLIPSIPKYNVEKAELLLIGQCEKCSS
jgi:Fur family ferric uptake transcriptional regulator